MLKILFIDDDRRKSRPLVRYLELVCRWQVTFVTTPDAALAELRKTEAAFDLILLDVMMPPGEVFSAHETTRGIDTGLLLLDRIAQLLESQPKVVIYSARRDLASLRDDPRVVECIQKPSTASEVATIVKELFR